MSGFDPCDEFNNCILDAVDCALEAKEEVCAFKAHVYLRTRTWSGQTVGDGTYKDEESRIIPVPTIQTFEHDMRIKEGGTVKSGDLLLKSISKKRYKESDLDLSIEDNQRYIEKFYVIRGKIYEVVSIEEQFATWSVLIRRIHGQAQDAIDPDESNSDIII